MNPDRAPDIMTPEQAAAYLQLDRETIYRSIRRGQLLASRIGRTYRIPRRAVDLFLWSNRTRPDVTLREYTGAEIEEFLATDQLDDHARAIVERFITSERPGAEGRRSTE
jgi:excisionase family DNA binding protein